MACFHVYSYLNVAASGEAAMCGAAWVHTSGQDFYALEVFGRPRQFSLLGDDDRFGLFTAQTC